MILKKTLRFSKKVDLSNLFNENFIKEVVFFKNNKTIDPTKK